MTKEKKIITYSSMIISFVLIFIYCLSPFAIGLNHAGNNSSFETAVGLQGANDGYFYTGYSILENSTDINGSMYKVIRPLVTLCDAFSDYFDIRILSFIYLILLLISVFYLNKYVNFGNKVLDIIFAVLIIFVVFDLSYLVYLNTLYAEGMFYVLLVFEVSLYIKLINSDKPQLPTSVVFCLVPLILCGLKANMFFIIIPFVFMAGYLIYKRKSITYRIIVGILSLLFIIYPVLNYSDYQNEDTDKFHSIFYGILYENKNPGKTLDKLNVDKNYISLAGKNQFDKLDIDIKTEKFKEDVLNKVSYSDIFKYYLSNPSEYVKQFKYVGWNAFETYPKYAGNFSLSSGKSPYDVAGGFRIYNLIKSKLFPKTLWFIYLIPLLLIGMLIAYKKIFNKGYLVLGVSLSIMNIILFNVPMITSGLVDISRTMAMYNVTFDIIFIMIIGCMLYISAKRKQEFKEKYGLTQ